jgi:hypothetical protein
MFDPVFYEIYKKGDLVEISTISPKTSKMYGIVKGLSRYHKNYYRVKVFGIHHDVFAGADQMKRIT